MDKDKLLRQYLDGDLLPKEEQRALHIIADDAEMRSMLRFEQKLSDSFPQNKSIDESWVPAGFTDRVMHRIEHNEQNIATDGFIARIKSWYRKLWIPRQVQWRPVYAVALAFVVLISLFYPLVITNQNQRPITDQSNLQNITQSVQQVSSGSDEVMLRFVYIDSKANSIAVAGDFNNWEPVELERKTLNGETVWTGLVSMSRGEHNYMFVKNGTQWVTDPLAPVQRDDGFGNKNAVIYI
jgi:hypothetical protein